MSEFSVHRTLDTHPALRYCLVLDDVRIAGGKPDYRGDNYLISWRTKETYGPVDALKAENDQLKADNAKLRELVSELWVSCPVHDSDCDECQHKGGRTGCELYDRMRELGVTE